MSTGLLLCDELRSGQAGVWEYISPSRLKCWAVCPLRFKFIYLDGIRSPTTPALFTGTILHRALETYYRHRHMGISLDPDDVIRQMWEFWSPTIDEEGMTFDSPAEEMALQKRAARLVTAYLSYVPQDERPVGVEVASDAPLVDPTTGENLGIPLVGIIDLILGGEGGPVIVDFKTSSRSSEPLEVVHEIQLTSYGYLFRRSSDEPEAGLEIRSLVKTKTPRIEFHAYSARTDAHFRRLFAVIREYLDALDAGRFNFRPGFHCGMCDFQTRCRRWAR